MVNIRLRRIIFIINWKQINGYDDKYKISNNGQVFSIKRDIIMKPQTDKDGYYYISLNDGAIKTKYKIHRLVAKAFIPNPNNFPEVNHLDYNRKNNNVDNLEWTTCKENIRYSSDNGRYSNNIGEKSWLHKTVQQIDLNTQSIIAQYFGTREAERETGIDHASIGRACNGKVKTAGGFRWRYICD